MSIEKVHRVSIGEDAAKSTPWVSVGEFATYDLEQCRVISNGIPVLEVVRKVRQHRFEPWKVTAITPSISPSACVVLAKVLQEAGAFMKSPVVPS